MFAKLRAAKRYDQRNNYHKKENLMKDLIEQCTKILNCEWRIIESITYDNRAQFILHFRYPIKENTEFSSWFNPKNEIENLSKKICDEITPELKETRFGDGCYWSHPFNPQHTSWTKEQDKEEVFIALYFGYIQFLKELNNFIICYSIKQTPDTVKSGDAQSLLFSEQL